VDERLLEQLRPRTFSRRPFAKVCAPSGNEITRALEALPVKPKILRFTAAQHRGDFGNLAELGRGTGRGPGRELNAAPTALAKCD